MIQLNPAQVPSKEEKRRSQLHGTTNPAHWSSCRSCPMTQHSIDPKFHKCIVSRFLDSLQGYFWNLSKWERDYTCGSNGNGYSHSKKFKFKRVYRSDLNKMSWHSLRRFNTRIEIIQGGESPSGGQKWKNDDCTASKAIYECTARAILKLHLTFN